MTLGIPDDELPLQQREARSETKILAQRDTVPFLQAKVKQLQAELNDLHSKLAPLLSLINNLNPDCLSIGAGTMAELKHLAKQLS